MIKLISISIVVLLLGCAGKENATSISELNVNDWNQLTNSFIITNCDSSLIGATRFLKVIEDQDLRILLIKEISKLALDSNILYILEKSNIGTNIYTAIVWVQNGDSFYSYRYVPSTTNFVLKVINTDDEQYEYFKVLKNNVSLDKKCENNGSSKEVDSFSIISMLTNENLKVMSVKLN